LLKPYFSTLLIIGGLKLTFDAIKTNSFPSSTFKHVAGIFYATGSTIDWTPMWFLPHLFISTLVAMLFIKTVRSKLAMALLAISLLTVGVRYLTPDDLPWSLDLIPISLPFILAGYICRDYTQKIRFQLPYFLISALLFCVLQVYFDETTDFNLRIYTNVFVNTLQALLGIYICLAASSFLVRYLTVSKALSYIGSSSIFILIFHGFFQSKVLHLMMKNSVTPVPSILISLTAGIAFPLLIWEIANRSQILKRLLLPKRSNTS
jgi:fucose 4-O-acetylase-like acetyltransferase